MTVHRIILAHSTVGAQGFHAWLDQWLLNVDAALQSEVDNDPPILRQQTDGNAKWHQGELAFAWDEGKTNILDNIEIYCDSHCDWYRLGYHACSHDRAESETCSYQEVRQSGPIPKHVTDVNVQG
jgi:hypothetical protein